ncbi:myc proto-oncogene protein [Hydra vulgaris]|uniref:Myc3 n=1 Tax=Hydra vulgaris TaxID=6087 RepID=A0A0H5FMB4_HYDVU|nr:myc proto-oncogene protein [Hydra vulgaris]XP_047134448.1 myc proto-oncogene protein [Hydra vulgaris]CRX73227.1 Myc3 [Hydra vulgaris]
MMYGQSAQGLQVVPSFDYSTTYNEGYWDGLPDDQRHYESEKQSNYFQYPLSINSSENNFLGLPNNQPYYCNPSYIPSYSPLQNHYLNAPGIFEHQITDNFEHRHSIKQEPVLSRTTHNVLERQRRNDLKIRFNILRDNIPELASNEKAPKIQILKKGLEHLNELKAQEQKLLVDLELEKQRRKILIRRLNDLKKGLY